MKNEMITNFIKALNNIEETDFSQEKAILKDDSIDILNDKNSTPENNFVAKLNEKYAILSSQQKIIEPNGLIRKLQIPKNLIYSNLGDEKAKSAIEKIQKILRKNSKIEHELNTIPDFIIHKGQEDLNPENQALIAEVKTEKKLSYKKFVWDFFKLNLYVEKLNFQRSIFLVINSSKCNVIEHLKSYINHKIYIAENSENIFLIIKENFNSKEITINLKEFLEDLSSNINTST